MQGRRMTIIKEKGSRNKKEQIIMKHDEKGSNRTDLMEMRSVMSGRDSKHKERKEAGPVV
jgi:hypothetical protein